MRQLLLIVALGALVCMMTGCSTARTPVGPPMGFIYHDVKAPLMVNYKGGDLGSKKGTSKSKYLYIPYISLGFAWDGVALKDACADGGISTLKAADYELFSVLYIWQKFTITAYGD